MLVLLALTLSLSVNDPSDCVAQAPLEEALHQELDGGSHDLTLEVQVSSPEAARVVVSLSIRLGTTLVSRELDALRSDCGTLLDELVVQVVLRELEGLPEWNAPPVAEPQVVPVAVPVAPMVRAESRQARRGLELEAAAGVATSDAQEGEGVLELRASLTGIPVEVLATGSLSTWSALGPGELRTGTLALGAGPRLARSVGRWRLVVEADALVGWRFARGRSFMEDRSASLGWAGLRTSVSLHAGSGFFLSIGAQMPLRRAHFKVLGSEDTWDEPMVTGLVLVGYGL